MPPPPLATEHTPCAVIVGVGDIDGIGGALCRRSVQGGLPTCVVGRTPNKVQAVVEALRHEGGQAHAIVNDLADAAAIERLFLDVEAQGLTPELVVFNAAWLNLPRRLLQTPAEVFEGNWQLTGRAGILVAQAGARRMLARGRGTLLVTGATASLRGRPAFAAFASAKAALRSFTLALAHELAPRGVHVCHAVIDGLVEGQRGKSAVFGLGRLPMWVRGRAGCLQPADVAEAYWAIHQQAPIAWTHELDLRPAKELF